MTTIWFKHREDAQDVTKLRMIAVAQNLPPEDYAAIVEQRFEVVPNKADDRGGFLVVIGSSSRGGAMPSSGGKKWWQFWR